MCVDLLWVHGPISLANWQNLDPQVICKWPKIHSDWQNISNVPLVWMILLWDFSRHCISGYTIVMGHFWASTTLITGKGRFVDKAPWPTTGSQKKSLPNFAWGKYCLKLGSLLVGFSGVMLYLPWKRVYTQIAVFEVNYEFSPVDWIEAVSWQIH